MNNNTEPKKRIFSAIQPSGALTIGNYLGALRNFNKLQDSYDCLYCIADLHSLTVRQEPKMLRQNTLSLYALYLACGLDPEKNILFTQSHVSAHAELCWILSCYTYMGELSRMTQFKEKSTSHEDNINAGLFTYPVLMASDILLYQADLVPVGQDQKQHLEITRDIAIRFNNIYSDTFKVPDAYIPKVGARIMSLQEPNKKMSKSDDNVNNFVLILDDYDTIVRKFKKAVTDSDTEIRYDLENKPGISNLISIYGSVTQKSKEDIEAEFDGKSYGEFKLAVGESVADMLKPVQERYNSIIKEKEYLNDLMAESSERAARIAYKTLSKVYRKVGLLQKK